MATPSSSSSADPVIRLPTDTARVVLSADPGGLPPLPHPSEPAVGGTFAGFLLTAELGAGGFARVYLARQAELAGRPMVLKVATGPATEPATLALLQHTNIVPVYSVHTAGRYHAVCMPFFGSTTLTDVLDRVKRPGGLPTTGDHLAQAVRDRRREVARSAGQEPTDPPPHATEQLDRLARLSHVDAVLWLTARLADGLDHAHTRGVVHRDLKPANVLLTDDGQPMLLDFNLADDTTAGRPAGKFGGTVSYMAPEHLRAFATQSGTVDARSDLYALGLILFELLCGASAHKMRYGSLAKSAESLLVERLKPPQSLRAHNPAVSPATEAIVHKLLAPDPADRYQSARHLREDLERQLAQKPLRHAPNPSARERAAKWLRRHPRVASAGTVGGLAAVLLVAGGLALWVNTERVLAYAASERFRQFRQEKRRLEAALGTGLADPAQLPDRVAEGWAALDGYNVRTDPDWLSRQAVARLSPADQADLRREVGELLFLTAVAAAKADKTAAEPSAQHCDQAAGLLPAGEAADLARWQADDLRGRPAPPPDPVGARTAHAAAFARIGRGQFAEAERLAQRAVDADPVGRPAAWFVLGLARHRLGRLPRAEAAYDAALALDRDNYWVRSNRGLVRLSAGDFGAARADFDECVRLRPDVAAGWLYRASARADADPAGAVADVTAALAVGGDPTRCYLFRAHQNRRLNRASEAEADLAEGLRHTPRDADGWVARGVGRMTADPDAALADFDRAVGLAPGNQPALMNKATLLAGPLRRPAEAVRALDALLAADPRNAPALAARAVLQARLGNRAAAHASGQTALAADRSADVLYRVAGVYARTAAGQPTDKDEALRLLSLALRAGSRGRADADPAFTALWADPEFRRVMALYPAQ